MSNWILALAGYDPEKNGRKMRTRPKRTEEKRTKPQTSHLQHLSVKTNPTTKKLEVSREINENSHEWETVQAQTDYGQRSAVLTDEERDYFSTTKNYTLEKAEILKPLWAAGLTPKQAAEQFNERGFSYDNIRRYFKVFNRHFALSPTETDRGDPQKGG